MKLLSKLRGKEKEVKPSESLKKGDNKEEAQKKFIDQLKDDNFKKAMIKASSDSDNEAGESTKFTLLENLHDRDKADFYTWYKNKDEIEQVNRLQTWARLFTPVFGESDIVKKCQWIVEQHVRDNMVNRASHQRGRESALVYAVKLDTGLTQTDNQIAKFIKK